MQSSSLHSGVRVLSPASTSSVPWRYPMPMQHHQQQHCRQHTQQQHARQPQHPHHLQPNQQQQLLQQQLRHHRCRSSASNHNSSSSSSQAFRFKHQYDPEQQSHLPQGSWAAWPLDDGTMKAAVAGEDTRIDPEQTLWHKQGPEGSINLRNPWSRYFRVTPVTSPLPTSLPGSDYWHVEMLNNYSRDWPSLKWVDGKFQFRKGFLEPFDDPKVCDMCVTVTASCVCACA